MKLQLSKYIILTEIPSNSDINRLILYSTRSGYTVVINKHTFNAIQSCKFEELPSSLLEVLIKNKVVIPSEVNEFEECLEENILFEKDSDTLSYTVQPTGQCQLGCHYCGQKHRNIVMTDEILQNVYDRIRNTLQSKKFKKVELTWYGGEPLIATKQIKSLSQQLISLCKEMNVRYSADIITNGVALTPKKVEVLVKDCLITDYQITLDGLKDNHNSNRNYKNGEGSFDKIISNIIKFTKSEVFKRNCRIAIRMNINKNNSGEVKKFIDFLVEKELQHSVSIDFCPIIDWGDNNASKNSLNVNEWAEMEIEWTLYAMNFGFNFGNILPERSFSPCMVTNDLSEVFDAYGDVYPCYELPYTPIYEKGKDYLGNVRTRNEIKTKKGKLRNWNEIFPKDDKIGCKKCIFFPVCGGGCPKTWLEGTPACPSFKFNIKDKLAIHYLKSNGINHFN